MEATVLNTDFIAVDDIHSYTSFIWSDRYDEEGDFEVYIPIKNALPVNIQKDFYLWNAESEHMMIIETIGVESSEEDGPVFKASGRSLESILRRRIVWNKMVFERSYNSDGSLKEYPNLQNGIKKMLDENVINPTMAARKIPNFIFEESTDDAVTSLTFEGEYLGNELYDVISKLCKENEIGWKITYYETYTKDGVDYENAFVFKLYAGADRSYNQDVNPYIVFSPQYNNIRNTNYVDSYKVWKNVSLVVGETEEDSDGNVTSRMDYELNNGSFAGMERREIFTDASSIKLEDEDGGIRTGEQYEALLRQKGIDTLMENTFSTIFDGQAEHNGMYTYREDYFIGDVVQFANEYGQEGRARVTEYIMSSEKSGISAYPTLTIIEKGVYEE